jgi:hypothetical protein
MPKMMTILSLTAALLLGLLPAQGAELASPDDTAHFLAGLAPSADSALAPLAKTAEWQQHARYFDSMFAQEDKNSLVKIRAFSKEQLTEKHKTMLYMFSGPDALYAVSFFPTASTYVLSGLEPVGAVPPLNRLPASSVDLALRNLEGSLGTIMHYSFFITHNMKTQLNTGQVYGTLPIIYVFLARTGKTIHDVSFVSLDPQGNVETKAPDDKDAEKRYAQSAAKGVKIVFSDGAGPEQTLYYFTTNLDDEGVATSGFLRFCDKLGPADSFVKSASYLMHRGSFGRVRSFILARSETVLQDDSGIPLAYFDPKKWQLQPFGRYLGPIGEFPGDYQTDMEELYRKNNPIPIDFGLGYRWRKNESNLLLARKLAPEEEGPVLTSALTNEANSPAIPSKSHRRHATSDPFWAHPFRSFSDLFGPRAPR